MVAEYVPQRPGGDTALTPLGSVHAGCGRSDLIPCASPQSPPAVEEPTTASVAGPPLLPYQGRPARMKP